MSFYGKEEKASICEGCVHWVQTIKFRLETGEIEIGEEYCDSEEELSCGCCPCFPKMNLKERLARDKEIQKFWEDYFSKDKKVSLNDSNAKEGTHKQ